ncbi:MAG: VWA domain-containing protein, partial [Verrucomicrobiota bacterium]
RRALKKSRMQVSLKPNDRVPNRDFVLRYRLADAQVKTAFMVDRGSHDNTFALLLEPPAETRFLQRQPREMIFVVDCSGSMRGRPLDKAKEAMRKCLQHLDERDTFQVIRFSSSASQLGPYPLKATPDNVRKGLVHIDQLNSGGGTRMIEGIKAALDMPQEKNRLRIVSFMTDGFIGNEDEILAAIHQRLDGARIFSFGVGNSVNRYLIESMARVGRGAAAFVGLDEGSGRAVDLFYERAAHPALTDLEIDWGGLAVSRVYPKQLPDLFPGRPIMITGTFKGEADGDIVVRGQRGGKVKTFKVAAQKPGADHEGIRFVWARQRMKELNLANAVRPAAELKNEMIRFSTEHSVLCNYTAFLAMDSSRITDGNHGFSVHVPVPVPDGVRYETTVK